MTPQETASMVRGLYESFNLRDLDRLDAVAKVGATVELLPFDVRAGLRDAWLNWARAFPDAKVEILRMEVEPDRAVVELIGRGTHTGVLHLPQGTLRPTHRKVELRFLETYELDEGEGKIRSGTSDFDLKSLFAQLGVPRPKQTPRSEPAAAEFHWGY